MASHPSPLRSASGSGAAEAETSSGLVVVSLRIFKSGLSAEAMANFVLSVASLATDPKAVAFSGGWTVIAGRTLPAIVNSSV